MLKEFVNENDIEYIKNALLGTILADGSISKKRMRYINSYLDFTHTAKNLDYIKAKKELLELIPNVKCRVVEHNKSTKDKLYLLFRLSTNCNLWFTELRDTIYDLSRIKLFRLQEIDKFNDLSLLLLYLDDGNLGLRYYEGTSKLREARVRFYLNSFALEEILYFAKWLELNYGIRSKWYKETKTLGDNRGFVIYLNTENTRKFMDVINKYYNAIPSMNYKFLQNYSL